MFVRESKEVTLLSGRECIWQWTGQALIGLFVGMVGATNPCIESNTTNNIHCNNKSCNICSTFTNHIIRIRKKTLKRKQIMDFSEMKHMTQFCDSPIAS